MGGDDLDDYDDAQWIQPMRELSNGTTKKGSGSSGSASSSKREEENETDPDTPHRSPASNDAPPAEKKRNSKRTIESITSSSVVVVEQQQQQPSGKKQQKEVVVNLLDQPPSSSSVSLLHPPPPPDHTTTTNNTPAPAHAHTRLLVQAGSQMHQHDAAHCAAFLSTTIQHYTRLEQSHHHSEPHHLGGTDDTDNDNSTDAASSSPPTTPITATITNVSRQSLDWLLSHHCLGKNPTPSGITDTATSSSSSSPLMDRIRQVVSIQQMKQWKNMASPCVVIVCLSARRAVAILKELSPLKVRTAKLFPKNGSVGDQQMQLTAKNGPAFVVAVGTPHRLCQLLSLSKSKSSSSLSSSSSTTVRSPPNTTTTPSFFSLDHTQLLILDCHVSHKQYTVCTLPDTAPQCAQLVRDHVVPTWSTKATTTTTTNAAAGRKKQAKGTTTSSGCCKIAFV